MRRALALLFAISTTLFGESDSSKPEPDSFDIEPPLLIPNRGDKPLPEPTSSSANPENVDLAKLEKQFERAKRSAAGAERFCKIGALSKVEAEQRTLRLVRLEFDLAHARLARAKEEMLGKEQQLASREIGKTDLSEAETALALAIEAAHAAAVKREHAELDAAEANVHRQEKLLALGSARKSDVTRAEQKLAELKGGAN
jgi:hypothetical protein